MLLISAAGSAQSVAQVERPSEVTLAGLQPGRDSLAAALKRYKSKYSSDDPQFDGEKSSAKSAEKVADKTVEKSAERQWDDACTGHSLNLMADAHGLIQQITVSSLVPLDGKCEDRRTDALDEKAWVTGQGLHLGDPQDRVAELYGEPNSSGPSVRGSIELEFLYYPFDRATGDAPREMEIYCARDTGRVVEITLAFPSR